MNRIPVYFVPGLAANKKIFEYLSLSEEKFDINYIEWIIPLNIEESIESYAKRMCEFITHKNPILIGVSFGGVMVQEMSKIIDCHKTIIISSIKSNKELPTSLQLVKNTKAYRLFPTKIIENIENYEALFFTDYLKKRNELYKIYLSVRDANYLQWAIYNVLHWQQEKPLENIIHIHGDKDEIFPMKYINNYIKINNGTHVMILDKAKSVSKVLTEQILK